MCEPCYGPVQQTVCNAKSKGHCGQHKDDNRSPKYLAHNKKQKVMSKIHGGDA